jgi:SAM-dependent methyltransferase
MLQADLLPWLRTAPDLGNDVLEIGPGPGLTSDLLRTRTAQLTCVEIDAPLAQALAERLAGTNVEVIHGDATATGLDADRFSSATCFSMLHHVPSPELQDQVFAEVHRVLRPGGHFLGTDSFDVEPIRQGHVDDVFVPINPATFPARLEAVGFTDVSTMEHGDYGFRFVACKPDSGGP